MPTNNCVCVLQAKKKKYTTLPGTMYHCFLLLDAEIWKNTRPCPVPLFPIARWRNRCFSTPHFHKKKKRRCALPDCCLFSNKIHVCWLLRIKRTRNGNFFLSSLLECCVTRVLLVLLPGPFYFFLFLTCSPLLLHPPCFAHRSIWPDRYILTFDRPTLL